jgi:glutathione S-transferase
VVRPIFFGKGLENVEEIRLAAEMVRQELKLLDTALTQSPWLVGDRITAADIAVFPLVQLLLRAAAKEPAEPLDLGLLPFATNYPALTHWVRQIEALPGYQRTYPPHWR